MAKVSLFPRNLLPLDRFLAFGKSKINEFILLFALIFVTLHALYCVIVSLRHLLKANNKQKIIITTN